MWNVLKNCDVIKCFQLPDDFMAVFTKNCAIAVCSFMYQEVK